MNLMTLRQKWERWRARRAERRQLRTWRKERRKASPDAGHAADLARGENYESYSKRGPDVGPE